MNEPPEAYRRHHRAEDPPSGVRNSIARCFVPSGTVIDICIVFGMTRGRGAVGVEASTSI